MRRVGVGLLAAQRLHRIEAGGAAGGEPAGEEHRGDQDRDVRREQPGAGQAHVRHRAADEGVHSEKRRHADEDPQDGLSSGLGLSLARQILADHGGALWYEDREGGGARFLVELPAAT